jgi:hypothetical protein
VNKKGAGDTVRIDKSSVMYLKRHLFFRLQDAYAAYRHRRDWSIHRYTSWACADEAALVAFRLGMITPSTYGRIKALMNTWR